MNNPNSKRYTPLNACDMCMAKAEERHRIISGSDYMAVKVVTLCSPCHRRIHKFYEQLKIKGYKIVKS